MTNHIFHSRHENQIGLTISEDGTRKLCTICFEFKLLTELYHDENGTPWDLCLKCARTELNHISPPGEGP